MITFGFGMKNLSNWNETIGFSEARIYQAYYLNQNFISAYPIYLWHLFPPLGILVESIYLTSASSQRTPISNSHDKYCTTCNSQDMVLQLAHAFVNAIHRKLRRGAKRVGLGFAYISMNVLT